MKKRLTRCIIAAAMLSIIMVPTGASAGVEWCCSPPGVDRAAGMGVLPTAPNAAGHIATPHWNPPVSPSY